MENKERYVYTARIAAIIDGDTLELNVNIGFKISLAIRIRLKDINTPEKNKPGYLEATEFWNNYFNKELVVETFKTKTTDKNILDRYGRYVCDIYHNGLKLNDELVKQGLAVVKKY